MRMTTQRAEAMNVSQAIRSDSHEAVNFRHVHLKLLADDYEIAIADVDYLAEKVEALERRVAELQAQIPRGWQVSK